MPDLLHFSIRALTAPTRLTLHLTGQALKLAGNLAETAIRTATGTSDGPAPSPTEPARPPATATTPPPEPTPRPAAEPVQYDTEPLTPLDPHDDAVKSLDDEPELVAEFAEPGAEEGAGANLVIDEPWDGYAEMTAEEVIARIGEADTAEVAIVELYEQAHKRRSTILSAAERRLQAERA